MKVLWANIEDVWREAAARWTLIAYFFLSTIFIIIFASAINLDIVDGALAGAKLFGKEVEMHGNDVSIEKLVLGFESGFSAVLYFLCTFLAIFATAHLVPRLQEKGTIDLYLSRPVSRTKLLLSRYVSGLLLAFAFLVGVMTSSTAVSIMASCGVFFFSAMLVAHDRIAAAVSHEWQAAMIQTLYWIIPKTAELGAAVFAFVSGNAFGSKVPGLTMTPVLTTAAFGAGSLLLAIWRFHKKEF
jgi:ABC-type transport system involved in multi-copper enzyme maturation permease subunit